MNRLVGNVISSIHAESRPFETVTSLLYVHMRVWVPGCNVNEWFVQPTSPDQDSIWVPSM